jgi:hypothetical protein
MKTKLTDFTSEELDSLIKMILRVEVMLDHGFIDEQQHNRDHLYLWKTQATQAKIERMLEERVNLN